MTAGTDTRQDTEREPARTGRGLLHSGALTLAESAPVSWR
jgi:hypothetical protein